MENRKRDLVEHLKYFIDICENNDIWYAASSSTLQGAVYKGDLIDGEEKLEIMMTIEGYKKLSKLFPSNLIDGLKDNHYPLINPKFLPENISYLDTSIFIDILIIVPTTTKKVKKWGSITNKRNYSWRKLHGNYMSFKAGEKIRKFLSFPFKGFAKRITFKTAYNMLYAEKNEGFFLIHNPTCKGFEHWIPHLTMGVTKIPFLDFEINIPSEYKTILEVKYGKNYLKPHEGKNKFIYVNSVSKKKIK